MPSTPRRSVEPSYTASLVKELRDFRVRLEALERGASLRNAAISGGDGLKVYGPDGNLRISLNTSDGAVVAYDPDGTAVARYGPLNESAPGEYGVEVLAGSTWVRLGYQSTTWDQVAGKPSTFPPSAHTQAGSTITSAVPLADGSEYGFNNNVSGTSFYALWVGNDGGFHFGRNTSSIRYKENVRDAALQEDAILALRPVVYDRKAKLKYPEDEDGNRLIGPPLEIKGAKDEFGLIAEEVAERLPEVVTYYDGQIDGIRYDLLGVAAIPVLQRHERELAELRQENTDLKTRLAALEKAVATLGGTA